MKGTHGEMMSMQYKNYRFEYLNHFKLKKFGINFVLHVFYYRFTLNSFWFKVVFVLNIITNITFSDFLNRVFSFI